MSKASDSILRDVVSQFEGKTADEIAAMVKRRGIKGRMGTTGRCPMALLMDGVSTGHYVIGRRFIARRGGEKIEQVRTPVNISTFVRKFDIGGYPELIMPPPRCMAQGKSKPRQGQRPGTSGLKKRAAIKNHVAKMVGRFDQ